MTTLYTLAHSQASPAALADTLAYLAPGASLLLYQDAVLMAAQPRFAEALAPFQLYVLGPDCDARGITPQAPATLVDYPGFVELTLQHTQTQAW